MALIGQIRKNSWLLIVMMALASVGVIVMYMTDDRSSLFGGSQFLMGKVDGEKIDWQNFSRMEEVMYRNSGADPYDRREYLWNYLTEEVIIKKEAEAVGLSVSKTELLDLQFGANPSPVIMQRFGNPMTGQLDREQLNQFRQAIESGTLTDPMARAFWAYQEKEIVKDRLQSKLGAMVAKGLYTPTWMAEMSYVDMNQRFDMVLVKVPFDELDNADVSLDDKDFQAYLKENASQFKQKEETRSVYYVAFNVEPTPADSAKYRENIAGMVPEFEAAENDSAFVEMRYGLIDGAYYEKDFLSDAVADTLFQMTPGTVYGPYLDQGSYMAVKLIDRKAVPDSVRSRHILVQANSPIELIQAQATVDSLKGLIEAGTHRFDSLALAFGSDATRDKGGDLDFAGPGMMVKPFNDLIFYEAEPNKLYTVTTQFGVHLVEVTTRKFINNKVGVKVAYLLERIEPSEATQSSIKDKAIALLGANRKLDELMEAAKGLADADAGPSPLFTVNGHNIPELGAGQPARDIVRWAFSAKKGEVSPEVYAFQNPELLTVDKFVVAGLRSIQAPGLPSIDNIREEIRQQVINKKKGEMLAEQMKGPELEALAAKFKTEIDTITNVNFASSFIPDLGAEPVVIATASGLPLNKLSEPVAGASGVFVLRVINKPEVAMATDLAATKRTVSSPSRAQIPGQLMSALVDKADVKDRRSRFY